MCEVDASREARECFVMLRKRERPGGKRLRFVISCTRVKVRLFLLDFSSLTFELFIFFVTSCVLLRDVSRGVGGWESVCGVVFFFRAA